MEQFEIKERSIRDKNTDKLDLKSRLEIQNKIHSAQVKSFTE